MPVLKVNEGRPNVVDRMINGEIQLVVNTPLGKDSFFDEVAIRRDALERDIPCLTTLTAASAALEAIRARSGGPIAVSRSAGGGAVVDERLGRSFAPGRPSGPLGARDRAGGARLRRDRRPLAADRGAPSSPPPPSSSLAALARPNLATLLAASAWRSCRSPGTSSPDPGSHPPSCSFSSLRPGRSSGTRGSPRPR